MICPRTVATVIALLLGATAAPAVGGAGPGPDRARADLIAATRDYRASLKHALVVHARAVDRATALLERKRESYRRGGVGRREVTDAARALDEARAQWTEARRQMAQADHALAEALAGRSPAPREYRVTEALIRYRGPATWSLAEAPWLDRFFRRRFGQALPISAYGQSPVHDQLGFDHHQGLDVLLHPDSREGVALLGFLRGLGVSFIAFRRPVAGAATGAHIHVGAPSPRLAAPAPPSAVPPSRLPLVANTGEPRRS